MTEFIKRRQLFANSMLDNSMAIFPANQELTRSNDTEFRFRQNSDFHYLCGFNEPDACLLLIKQNDQLTTVLFNRKKDKTAEIWHGYRLGQEAAINSLAIDQAFVIDEFESKLTELLVGIDTLY